jgi:hypothetical protein
MASTSGMCCNRAPTEQEVIEYLHEIDNAESSDFESESDSGSSDIGSVKNSDDSDGECESGEASHTSRKRQRPNSPLFQWQSGNFTPTKHNFDNSISGIQDGKIQDEPTALEIFQLFLSKDIMQKIVDETIIICSQHRNCHQHQNHDYRIGKPLMSFLFSLQSQC